MDTDQEKKVRKTTRPTCRKDEPSWNRSTSVRRGLNLSEYSVTRKLGGLQVSDMNEEDKRHRKGLSTESSNNRRTKSRKVEYWKEDKHKAIRLPNNFPGVTLPNYHHNEHQDFSNTDTKLENKEPSSNVNLEDIEKVLTSTTRKENHAKVKLDSTKDRISSKEKLSRIKISETRESSTRHQPATTTHQPLNLAGSQSSSHHFNYARLMTELHEVCRMKDNEAVHQGVKEANLLTLKTVHLARRYSAFSPRPTGDRVQHHTRCRSLPNIDVQGLPRRYFVKLDPVRASAIPVNLSARNESARRCRIVSENLRKLDEQGVTPTENERKAMIGQWIRETAQLRNPLQEQSSTGSEITTS